jgi:putative membrane protein
MTAMKRVAIATFVLALALLFYLVHHLGFESVLRAAERIGWAGFVVLCGYSIGVTAILGCAWFSILPATDRKIWEFIWARAVRDASGDLLPFSPIGGFLIGARAICLRGMTYSLALASTIVDVTVEMVAQIFYVLFGVSYFVATLGPDSASRNLALFAAMGLLIATACAAGFVFAQRASPQLVSRWAKHWLPAAARGSDAFLASILAVYRQPLRLAAGCLLHLLGWFASAGSTYALTRLIGLPVSLVAIVTLESLISATKSVAFVVPAGLGIQEASYALLAPFFGMDPQMGIAISLFRRARDIAIGVPILVLWNMHEGHTAIRARPAADNSPRLAH